MLLKDFDEWYQLTLNYYENNPDYQDCIDQIRSSLSDLQDAVNNYRSSTGDNYIWFKRVISTMISYRMSKYHMTYPEGVPDISSKYEYYTDLLSAFIIELPPYDDVFSVYTTSSSSSSTDTTTTTTEPPCDHVCSSETDDTTGTTTYKCLDTSKVDNLIDQIQNAPKADVDRIFDFIRSLNQLDRSLYIMFTSTAPISVDDIDVRSLAIEAKLDEVVAFYNWTIPGFN